MQRTKALLVVFAAIGAAGCRPDPGVPTYRNADDFLNPDGPDGGPVEGPDPYEAGEARLALGIFYEGDFSEQVIIDDETTHFYIYDGTFSLNTDNSFVQEGRESDRITHAGTGYWGGGITWDESRDLSLWTTLYGSFRSEDPAFADFEIRIAADNEGTVQASAYGYANDGEWHHLAIPLTDYSDIDLTQVTGPLVLIGSAGDNGERLYIDNVYYTQD